MEKTILGLLGSDAFSHSLDPNLTSTLRVAVPRKQDAAQLRKPKSVGKTSSPTTMIPQRPAAWISLIVSSCEFAVCCVSESAASAVASALSGCYRDPVNGKLKLSVICRIHHENGIQTCNGN